MWKHWHWTQSQYQFHRLTTLNRQTDGRSDGHLLPRLGVAFIWHRFKRERLVNGSNSCHRFLGFYILLCCFFCGSLTFDLNFVALENVLKINPTRIHHSSFIKQNKKKEFQLNTLHVWQWFKNKVQLHVFEVWNKG